MQKFVDTGEVSQTFGLAFEQTSIFSNWPFATLWRLLLIWPHLHIIGHLSNPYGPYLKNMRGTLGSDQMFFR